MSTNSPTQQTSDSGSPGDKAKQPDSLSDKKAKIAADRQKARDLALLAIARMPKPTDVQRFVPSSAKSLSICPSHIPFMQEEQNTRAADKGTDLHACVEAALKDSSTRGFDRPNARPRDVSWQNGLSQQEIDWVHDCLFHLEDLIHKPGLMAPPWELMHTELKFKDIFGIPGCNGKIDFLFQENAYTVHVVDFKFGAWEVDDASLNWQGFLYCGAVWESTKWRDAKEIIVTFLCPKRGEMTAHRFTRDPDYLRIKSKAWQIVDAIGLPPLERPYFYDAANCEFCARIASCPAIAALANGVLKWQRGLKMDHESLKERMPFIDQNPAALTEEEVAAQAYALGKTLEQYFNAAKEQSKQFQLGGHIVPGLKLVEKAGTMSLTDQAAEEIYKEFVSATPADGKISIEALLSLCKLNHKDFLDAMTSDAPDGEKAKRMGELTARLSQLGVLTQGASVFYSQLAR